MILRDLYHRDLAQASYFLGCAATGEAMIIDPNRDVDQYTELADREGLAITAITETHIHADYVSGARELAKRTGATIYLSDEGPDDWKYAFADELGATLIKDGDTIWVGNIRVDVLYTPGHTPEHVSFLVTDTAGADQPMGIFTGDFVFVGDVGRPDLLEKAAGHAGTMEDGARKLHQSIQRVKELPDFVQIWPGHGAGSACGKALGAVPQTTIGYERLFNWAFQIETAEEFVQAVLEDQPEPPVYFAQMKKVNKEGPALLSELPSPRLHEITALAQKLDAGEHVVDTRPGERFAERHIPGTFSIPFDSGFVTWAGWLLPYDRPFSMIADPEKIEEITHELRMIGLDSFEGYWPSNVVDQWETTGGRIASVEQVSVAELDRLGDYQVIDVRGATEYNDGHIPGSRNIPVGYVRDRLDEIPTDQPVVFQCQTGRRSAIAASLAAEAGRSYIYNLTGGFSAWHEAGKNVESESKEPAAAS